MLNFLTVLSNVLYVFFIVSAITFGISLAVKTLLIKTVKKINKESDKNFGKISDIEEKSKCEEIILSLTERYVEHSENVKKIKGLKRKNRVRKFLKLKEYQIPEQTDTAKDIFISTFKDISSCFELSGGYLNLSKNELLFMLRALTERVEKILKSSDVIWLKTIKIPFYVEAVKLYSSIEKFKLKPSVIIVSYLINFCLSVSRFISPVGATKKLAGSVFDDSFSSLLTSTVISVVGKEWAVLCFEKEQNRKVLLSSVA